MEHGCRSSTLYPLACCQHNWFFSCHLVPWVFIGCQKSGLLKIINLSGQPEPTLDWEIHPLVSTVARVPLTLYSLKLGAFHLWWRDAVAQENQLVVSRVGLVPGVCNSRTPFTSFQALFPFSWWERGKSEGFACSSFRALLVSALSLFLCCCVMGNKSSVSNQSPRGLTFNKWTENSYRSMTKMMFWNGDTFQLRRAGLKRKDQ